MGYHHVPIADLEQHDDRAADVRSISGAVGLDHDGSPLGLRVYVLEPGEQAPLTYHYHDEQTEVFYVLEGELAVETPDATFAVGADEAFVAEPGSPHRAHNPAAADAPVRTLAMGAPSVVDHHVYDPDEE
ncbi:cupin domain-containing protein [Natronomonas sp.]|uniref:cupin domain-containing protein n=1 Tax=Natronomonas sp. TaxID=2184060 RepID=UPI002639C151|nr:cupin domain-containing protein [Natronomonas sp.]